MRSYLLQKKQTFLTENDTEGMTKLGEQLENPYSVSNMKKALESLIRATNPDELAKKNIEITTTHLYIRFKPKDENELAILKKRFNIRAVRLPSGL